MEIVRDKANCPRPPEGTVVTIGAYDGVHAGHRAVIAQVSKIADSRGLSTAVVTFDRHPASIVRPESAPKLLTDLEQKIELLSELDVDYCLVIHFDEERSTETATDFVNEVLISCLNVAAVVVGEDFHFGHHRGGNVALLHEMGSNLGFTVEGLELVSLDGRTGQGPPVSSTRIRAALRSGDLDGANAMLGRNHEVRGVVAHGDKLASELGYPTANVSVPEATCLPADGVYAGWYVLENGDHRPAALSLGRRPTFYQNQPYSLLEAHLLDVDGDIDLYGRLARVQFANHLRSERRFDTVDELSNQIGLDCDAARSVLGL